MLLFFIIIAILILVKTPTFKGMIGELVVRFVIGETVEKEGKEKYVINNLLLQLDNGKTSQIDHVVINTYGVHVIETKNYAGRIYGNDSQHEWTQVLNYGKVKNHFYNPVKQNFTHIYAIRQLLPEETPIYSLIVFVKSNIEYIKSNFVCSPWSINKKMNKNSEVLLSLEEMKNIYDILIANNKSNEISNREHVKNIKDMKEDIENNICPRCKGKLIEKKGKYGKFLACSNYPDCKFTKQIDK